MRVQTRHCIQFTAQNKKKKVEKKNHAEEKEPRVSKVECTWFCNISSLPPGVNFHRCACPFVLIHLLGVTERKAALPEMNAEYPDAWQAVCGALLQTGRAHLETHLT
ncbi:hypothetical protein CHARACLAT_015663, partial [Characodon lateralis]|nr:hypothetical protein [Characodon lateralis]